MLRSMTLSRRVLLATMTASALIAAKALATMSCGSKNPQLTVCASLLSNGANPDLATLYDTIMGSASVTNNTTTLQTPTVFITITAPNGMSTTLFNEVVPIPAGQTASLSDSWTVGTTWPTDPGKYVGRVQATNANGTSSAEAIIAVY